MSVAAPRHDVIVIGGGPAGATAALVAARAGLDVVVLERSPFPRFRIGESLLPRSTEQLAELGLLDRVSVLPHTRKFGVEFAMGDGSGEPAHFWFREPMMALNVERGPFDAALLEAAACAGATVRQPARVQRVTKLDDGDVRVMCDGQEIAARVILDASGPSSLLGRDGGRRRVIPQLRKVAWFGHFTGVQRAEGRAAGSPAIVMCDEAWFWLIPIDESRTSVGIVMDADAARQVSVPPAQMLQWGIQTCPVMARRCAGAVACAAGGAAADFSYSCAPYAGPGHFLAGDAATFLDPVFSTGVCIGMQSGEEAARCIIAMLRGGLRPAAMRRRYQAFMRRTTRPLFRLVRGYYDHAFRELLLEQSGPFGIHRAVIDTLAGCGFPRLPLRIAWRLAAFHGLVRLQRRRILVPPRRRFALTGAAGSHQALREVMA